MSSKSFSSSRASHVAQKVHEFRCARYRFDQDDSGSFCSDEVSCVLTYYVQMIRGSAPPWRSRSVAMRELDSSEQRGVCLAESEDRGT